MTTPEDWLHESRIQAVFTRFGWEVTDSFKDRYWWGDPMIYHLTNGLVSLAEENERLRAELESRSEDARH